MMDSMRFEAVFSKRICWEKMKMKPGMPGTVFVYGFRMNINKTLLRQKASGRNNELEKQS